MDLHEARGLALDLMARHGLIETGWAFEYDGAKQRLGSCRYRQKVITLSRLITKHCDRHDVEQVLLHEIAHALAGPTAKHGPKWLATARSIGYEGGRTSSAGIEVSRAAAPYLLVCRDCGYTDPRHRRPPAGRIYRHPKCGDRPNRGQADLRVNARST